MNGIPLGNIQFKAHVVEDLKMVFDTHSIAGEKMAARLLGPSFPNDTDNSTEPTDYDNDSSNSAATNCETAANPKRRKRKKKFTSSAMANESSEESSPAHEGWEGHIVAIIVGISIRAGLVPAYAWI